MSTRTTTPTIPATGTTDADAAAQIGELRGEIDACDAEIIALVQRRLAISQQIGKVRAASGGTRLNLSREQQVLSRFRAALGRDGAALGMLLLRQGRGRL
jgi:chorismate mutase